MVAFFFCFYQIRNIHFSCTLYKKKNRKAKWLLNVFYLNHSCLKFYLEPLFHRCRKNFPLWGDLIVFLTFKKLKYILKYGGKQCPIILKLYYGKPPKTCESWGFFDVLKKFFFMFPQKKFPGNPLFFFRCSKIF